MLLAYCVGVIRCKEVILLETVENSICQYKTLLRLQSRVWSQPCDTNIEASLLHDFNMILATESQRFFLVLVLVYLSSTTLRFISILDQVKKNSILTWIKNTGYRYLFLLTDYENRYKQFNLLIIQFYSIRFRFVLSSDTFLIRYKRYEIRKLDLLSRSSRIVRKDFSLPKLCKTWYLSKN